MVPQKELSKFIYYHYQIEIEEYRKLLKIN